MFDPYQYVPNQNSRHPIFGHQVFQKQPPIFHKGWWLLPVQLFVKKFFSESNWSLLWKVSVILFHLRSGLICWAENWVPCCSGWANAGDCLCLQRQRRRWICRFPDIRLFCRLMSYLQFFILLTERAGNDYSRRVYKMSARFIK